MGTRFTIAVVLCFAAACGDDGGGEGRAQLDSAAHAEGDVVGDLLTLHRKLVEVACSCDENEASQESCVESAWPAEVMECARDVFTREAKQALESLECFGQTMQRMVDCQSAEVCDYQVMGQCFTEFQNEVTACPASSESFAAEYKSCFNFVENEQSGVLDVPQAADDAMPSARADASEARVARAASSVCTHLLECPDVGEEEWDNEAECVSMQLEEYAEFAGFGDACLIAVLAYDECESKLLCGDELGCQTEWDAIEAECGVVTSAP